MPALAVRRPRVLLELDLTEMPVEQEPNDPLARLRGRGRHGLRTTLRALHEAAGDPRVVGLIAKVGGALPWAGMQELRLVPGHRPGRLVERFGPLQCRLATGREGVHP